jgi:hypothetical protein
MTEMIVGPQNYYIGTGVVSALQGYPNVTFWEPSTTYAVGDAVINFTASPSTGVEPLNVYTCTTAGLSGTTTGPQGVGTGLADGAGAAVWSSVALHDVGNVSNFDIQLEVKTIEHNSNRLGVAVLDDVTETQRRAKFSATLEEVTPENLALTSLGTVSGTAPHRLVKMGAAGRANMIWQFVGANTKGKQYQVLVARAAINPPKDMKWIGDKYMQFDCSADVFVMNDGAFYYVAELN